MASFRMEMRKFEINYAKIGGERGRGIRVTKCNLPKGRFPNSGLGCVKRFTPIAFFAVHPLRAVSNGYFAVWGNA